VGEIRLKPFGARIDEHCTWCGGCLCLNMRVVARNGVFKRV
jgi:hypothetical protein